MRSRARWTWGPPNELVHVVIDASGTDARAELRHLELRQRAGQLALSGTIEFKPVAWSLYAKASDFNPGALFTGWNGRVNIDAHSRGVLAEEGPARSAADRNALGRAAWKANRGRGQCRVRSAIDTRRRLARVVGPEPHFRERIERRPQ
jgi:translocation and assembly module TamB